MGGGITGAAIERALARRTAAAADAPAIAAAAIETWQLVAMQIAPVIGARGFDVLLSRSLHLTSARFPFLGDDWATERVASRAELLAGFGRRLAKVPTQAATEASGASFVNFHEALGALIGASLARRLLEPVWAPPAPVPNKENV
jgi:hypothetical protein